MPAVLTSMTIDKAGISIGKNDTRVIEQRELPL
jgi:hypothetical protein